MWGSPQIQANSCGGETALGSTGACGWEGNTQALRGMSWLEMDA